jgi:inosine triphosphate pyrophosphatase
VIVTLVTGNKGKLVEWQRLFPAEIKLEAVDVDLDEIQSLDLVAIVTDKARRAFEVVGNPVIVEDVSAGLDKLHGLPGPFIKYFEIALGLDALFQLAEAAGDPATVTCTCAYFDGKTFLTASGAVQGTVVPARGAYGFGFDHVFTPLGTSKTYGEMDPDEKDAVSHRSIAVRNLVMQLTDANLV